MIKKLILNLMVLVQISSCAYDVRPHKDFSFKSDKSNVDGYATVALKVKSNRLVYLKKGVEKNALMIKWCRVGPGDCKEYFYSYHCDVVSDLEECKKIASNLDRNPSLWRRDDALSIFFKPYGFYRVKAGHYYLGELREIGVYSPNFYHEVRTGSSFELQNPLMEKRKSEMQEMNDDPVISKALFGSGLLFVGITAHSGGGGGGIELVFVAIGGSLIVVGMIMNGVFTGDFLFVDKFASNNAAKGLISFEARKGEMVYPGDISLSLFARGGSWSSRREGLVDVFIENQAQNLWQNFPESRMNGNFTVRFARLGSMVGKYGVGKF